MIKKSCYPTGLAWLHKKCHLPKEDRRALDRIEELTGEIERQFVIAELFVQRQLQRPLLQVIEQAITAMQIGQKLSVLLEFLENEDLTRLAAEEQQLRDLARETPAGPLGALHSQTCRFKAQQIANVLNAQRNAALYRAQIYALEAGLSNVRGRMAAMVSIEPLEVGIELEALDAELCALNEGMRMAARAVAGDYFHAGGRFKARSHATTATHAPHTASSRER